MADITCRDAGIIVRVPYKHADTFLHKGKEADESLRSIPEWDYQLVAALTRIRLQRYDDDFCDFMRHGALRRSYVQVYVDLFSYQPRSARCDPRAKVAILQLGMLLLNNP